MKGVGAAGQRRDILDPLHKMKNNGNSIVKNNGDIGMEYAILLAINKKMYDSGLITKEEKEEMDMEILREK